MKENSTPEESAQPKEPSQIKQKLCFIITPMGEFDSKIRKKSNGIIQTIIKPELEKFDYTVIPPWEISETGSITNQIITHLIEDDLVIANLTDLNPNVMYELAVRHAAKKPVISLMENTTKLPFDLKDERTITYYDEIAEVTRVRAELEKAVASISENSRIDNPIYKAMESFKLQEILIGEPSEFINKKLDDIYRLISSNMRPTSYNNDSNLEYYRTSVIFNMEDQSKAWNAAVEFLKKEGISTNRIQSSLGIGGKAVISFYYLTSEGDLGSRFHWHIKSMVREGKINPSTQVYDHNFNPIPGRF